MSLSNARGCGLGGAIFICEEGTMNPPLNGCMCQDGTCESCNKVAEGHVIDKALLQEALRALNTAKRFRCSGEANGVFYTDSYQLAALIELRLGLTNKKEDNPWTNTRETF